MERIYASPRYVIFIIGLDSLTLEKLGGSNSEKLENEVILTYERVIRS